MTTTAEVPTYAERAAAQAGPPPPPRAPDPGDIEDVGQGDAPAEPGAPGAASAEAPYGYKSDGSPRRSNGGRRRAPGAPGAPPRARRPSGAGRPRRPAAPDYRTAVLGLFQLPAGALGMLAATAPAGSERRTALLADAAALTVYAPGVADALAALARESAEIAAVLDRIMTVGPYGALLAALLPMVVQIAANHALVPAGVLGAVAPEEMAAHLAGPVPAGA